MLEERAVRECLVVAYGAGVDSTAMLVGLRQRGIRPDAVLFADTGGEKQQTYDFLPVMDGWLRDHGFPTVTVVKQRGQGLQALAPVPHAGGELPDQRHAAERGLRLPNEVVFA